MKNTYLKHLTLETTFLLALAYGKRCSEIHAWMANIVSNLGQWEKLGYLGFSTVTPPPLPQRFPFRRDNLKNILHAPFKFGMWIYMFTNAIVL